MSGQTATQFERIERIGKHLFGVAACVLVVPGWHAHRQESEAHIFCAQSVIPDQLQILPEQQSPFQPALGRAGQIEIRFQALQPVRDASGTVIGLLSLLHDRPRAFTAGDRALLADLLALVERAWHLLASPLEADRASN